MANERYLLGYTQTLKRARFVSHPPGPPPYDLDGQRQRLLPQLQSLATAAEAIPAEARANGQVVAVVQLNPQALSRSAFPQALFKHADWRLLGSRSNRVKPTGGTRAKYEDPSLTTDLFVAATPAKDDPLAPGGRRMSRLILQKSSYQSLTFTPAGASRTRFTEGVLAAGLGGNLNRRRETGG